MKNFVGKKTLTFKELRNSLKQNGYDISDIQYQIFKYSICESKTANSCSFITQKHLDVTLKALECFENYVPDKETFIKIILRCLKDYDLLHCFVISSNPKNISFYEPLLKKAPSMMVTCTIEGNIKIEDEKMVERIIYF